MKNKILSMLCTMVLAVSMLLIPAQNTEASSELPMVDGSYLTYDTESIGYATGLTRGANLLAGYSKVVRLGPGVIYAGGSTLAVHQVKSAQVSVMIERVKKEGEDWQFVTSWHKELQNCDRVSSNREVLVEGNYYYRVRSTHSADGEMSSSVTDGIFIETR